MSVDSLRPPAIARAARRRTARGRTLLIALGGVSLMAGLDAALLRLDLWAPVESARLGDAHGQLMVLGFLGTLISLERAQSLGQSWGYLAPAAYGAGALALLSPASPLIGQLLHVEAGLLFVAVYIGLWRRTPRTLVAVQLLSAVLALGGAAVTVLVDLPHALPWLFGFIVITIAGERAEQAAMVMGPKADTHLLALAAALTLAILVALTIPAVGERLVGVTLVVIALWLGVHDVVRYQLKTTGQRRFVAVALLAGYVNLAIAGAVLAVRGLFGDVGSYDVAVHGVFLGFAISMVMAHAPIILPAVLGRPLPYAPALWVPLTLLHVGLAARFVGALAGVVPLWQAGGVVGVLSLLLFVGTAATLVVRG